jgi:hypothetical protein
MIRHDFPQNIFFDRRAKKMRVAGEMTYSRSFLTYI